MPRIRPGQVRRFVAPFRVDDGRGFRLEDHDPGDSKGIRSKEDVPKLLSQGVEHLAERQ